MRYDRAADVVPHVHDRCRRVHGRHRPLFGAGVFISDFFRQEGGSLRVQRGRQDTNLLGNRIFSIVSYQELKKVSKR